MRKFQITRRQFLVNTTAASACTLLPERSAPSGIASEKPGFPLQDLHVHLDNSTIDKVLELSRERGVKFGIVEHAGTKENVYPVVLSNDDELLKYLSALEGKPVFKGIQAEWTDWLQCFSKKALGRLDFVLKDAWTFPGKDNRRVKLWESGAESMVDFSNREAFMDRFVDWHVQTMALEPIDILANLTWLPAPLAAEFDRYWTPARVRKVIDAGVKHKVAFEISSRLKLPNLVFLKQAKAAGIKFSMGSNGRYPEMGKLDYCVAAALELGLQQSDMFTPQPGGLRSLR